MPYPLDTILLPMKPSKIKKDNKTHLARLQSIKSSKRYTVEEKIDGISIFYIHGRAFTIRESKTTGFPLEKTLHMPQISGVLENPLFNKAIFSGEAYLPGKKCNKVTSILNSDVSVGLAKQTSGNVVHYRLFDMLKDIDGTDMRDLPWEARRERLSDIYENHMKNESPYLELNCSYVCDTIEVDEYLEEILAAGREGVVFKNLDDKYYCDKRPMFNWVKVKAEVDDIDVFITGYEPAKKEYTGKNITNWPYWIDGLPVTQGYYNGLIGSIKIGMYDKNGNVVDKGKVSGMSEAVRVLLTKQGDKYLGEVIKIKAMEETEDGKFRHGSFIDFHGDKSAKSCRIE